jgi:histidinol-phosphatase
MPSSELLDFARSLAQAAGEAIRPHFRQAAAEHKADGSEVTAADRAAEAVIRTRIAARYPTHAILGEEEGGPDTAAQAADAPALWVVDPLDGTAGFAMGVPLFGVLIGFLEHGTPTAGVIHFPMLDETVYAAQDHGCWFAASDTPHDEARRVSVDPVETLDAATVTTGYLHRSDLAPGPGPDGDAPYRLSALMAAARKFRFVTDCYQHALVARGQAHVAVDTLMRPWDVAALVPCVREAGGVAVTADGASDDVVFGDSLVTASTPALADAAVEALQPL